jgi:hypothetical protein
METSIIIAIVVFIIFAVVAVILYNKPQTKEQAEEKLVKKTEELKQANDELAANPTPKNAEKVEEKKEEVKKAIEEVKKVDCKVSDWSEYSQCEKIEGIWKKKKNRSIITQSEGSGLPCPTDLEMIEDCPKIDCKVSDWSEYSQCEKIDGVWKKKKSRTIIKQPQYDGTICPKDLEMIENCPKIDCKVSDWSEYSQCEKIDGVWKKKKSRTIITQPQYDGTICPSDLLITENCKVDCKMSDWSSWSECDNLFQKKRTRKIITTPQYGGEPCGVTSEIDNKSCIPDILYNVDPSMIDQTGTGDIKVPIILYSDIGYQGIEKKLKWNMGDGYQFLQVNKGGFDADTYLWKSMKVNPGTEIEIYSSSSSGNIYRRKLVLDHNISNLKQWFLNLPDDVLGDKGLFFGLPARTPPTRWEHFRLSYFIKPVSLKRTFNKAVPIATLYPENNYQGTAYALYPGDSMSIFKQNIDKSETWYWKSLNIPADTTLSITFSSYSSGNTYKTTVTIDSPISNLQEWINSPEFGTSNRNAIFYPSWAHWNMIFRITMPSINVEKLSNAEIPNIGIPYSYIRSYKDIMNRLQIKL